MMYNIQYNLLPKLEKNCIRQSSEIWQFQIRSYLTYKSFKKQELKEEVIEMPFFSEGFRLNITYNLLIIQLTNLSMHVLNFVFHWFSPTINSSHIQLWDWLWQYERSWGKGGITVKSKRWMMEARSQDWN